MGGPGPGLCVLRRASLGGHSPRLPLSCCPLVGSSQVAFLSQGSGPQPARARTLVLNSSPLPGSPVGCQMLTLPSPPWGRRCPARQDGLQPFPSITRFPTMVVSTFSMRPLASAA